MLTLFEIAEKLADFGDDHLGGAIWVRDHFNQFSEADRDRIYLILIDHIDEMPKEAQSIVGSLTFKCEAGRKRAIAKLEESCADLPDGPLRRALVGDDKDPFAQTATFSNSRLWSIIMEGKNELSSGLRGGLAYAVEQGEQPARKFIAENVKAFPAEMRDAIIGEFVIEAIETKNRRQGRPS